MWLAVVIVAVGGKGVEFSMFRAEGVMYTFKYG